MNAEDSGSASRTASSASVNGHASAPQAIGTVERVDDCLVVRLGCFGRYEGVPLTALLLLAATLIKSALGGRGQG